MKGDEKAAQAPVAVEEWMDGFELDVRQSSLDHQRNIPPFLVEKDFELTHTLHDAVCRRRNKRGVSWTRTSDPILASTKFAGLFVTPPAL
jgi:hypothetical protein